MNSQQNITIKGAREHNLKNIDITLPRNKFIVISGVSGSGKSSLAFDTIYAEGQRRYVESLSAYARQFLGQMEKPDLDYIEGLSPAISIEQKTTHNNPRSTVGTVTEVYDYLRLLFARIGEPFCYKCGKKIESQSIDSIIDSILNFPEGSKIQVLAQVIKDRKGEYQKVFEDAKRSGFLRVRVDGINYQIDEDIKLDKNKRHTIEIVVDRIIIKDGIQKRLTESVETALKLTNGTVSIECNNNTTVFSEKFACIDCGINYPDIQPRLFSFNAPHGCCEHCHGLGELREFSLDKIIPDESLSLNNGAVLTHLPKHNFVYQQVRSVASHHGIDLNTPWKDLSTENKNILLYGSSESIHFVYKTKEKKGNWEYEGKFKGIVNDLNRRYRETTSDGVRKWFEGFMSFQTCTVCKGKRLNEMVLSILINGKNIIEVTEMPVTEAIKFFENLNLTDNRLKIASKRDKSPFIILK